MNYRRFLREAQLQQLREGRGGLRLVGCLEHGADGAIRLGLIVPYYESDEDWEAAAESARIPVVDMCSNK